MTARAPGDRTWLKNSKDPVARGHLAARAGLLAPSRVDRSWEKGASDIIDLAMGSSELTPPTLDHAVAPIDGRRYSPPEGTHELRSAISASIQCRFGINVDPDRNITVTCGATEGLLICLMTLLESDDEVIILEPCYDGYLSAMRLAGGRPRFVRLHRPDWHIDMKEFCSSFSVHTKAVILNSPHNPTGKVFAEEELNLILSECYRHGVMCISDEVYDSMVFDGLQHISPLMIPDAKPWVIVLNSMSKTYHAAGWRIGYMITPQDLTETIRLVRGVTSYCAAEPLQARAVPAFMLPNEYYHRVSDDMRHRRDRLLEILLSAGLPPFETHGGMYVLSSLDRCRFANDVEFTDFLLTELGIAAVAGRAFYGSQDPAEDMVRFCFARSDETLEAVAERMKLLGN
jgi:aspartate/methionine/tyrosine aminotransferase